MNKTKALCAIFFIIFISSCSRREEEVEAKAGEMVSTARELMMRGEFAAAKDTILFMRQQYPTALGARRVGLVVLDSVELLAAEDSLAIISEVLQKEQAILDSLDDTRTRGHNAAFYSQRTKVFHLKQQCDEADAKVKFYLRKIEVDIEENKKAE